MSDLTLLLWEHPNNRVLLVYCLTSLFWEPITNNTRVSLVCYMTSLFENLLRYPWSAILHHCLKALWHKSILTIWHWCFESPQQQSILSLLSDIIVVRASYQQSVLSLLSHFIVLRLNNKMRVSGVQLLNLPSLPLPTSGSVSSRCSGSLRRILGCMLYKNKNKYTSLLTIKASLNIGASYMTFLVVLK